MKKILRIILLPGLSIVAIFSILLVIKPGASIFHLKKGIQNEGVRIHDGYAFRYPVNLNTLVIPLENVLLYENGTPLDRTYTREVVEMGKGKYSLVEQDGKSFLNFRQAITAIHSPTIINIPFITNHYSYPVDWG